jgi:4-hydroxybenzoate polyprenyltransferase
MTTPSTPAGVSWAARLRRGALGLVLVVHPIPSALYVVAVGAFSWLAAVAAHHPLDPGRLARVLVAMACAQCAIGATNDYLDRPLDARTKPSKPLVRGLIAPDTALLLAIMCSALLVLVMTPLGLLPLILGLLVELLGLAYDFGLKGTPVSALLYAVYFPLIPLLAWSVFGRAQPFLPWVLPLGALLGIAMNVANSLPDLEDDLAQGVRGLPHLLGLRRGLAVAWGGPVLALCLLWLLDISRVVPATLPAMLFATAAGLLSLALAIGLYQARPGPATLRLTFLIQAAGVVALAVGWLAAVAF